MGSGCWGDSGRARLIPLITAVVAAVAFVLPSLASAHLERPSYWPDPRADTAGSTSAGGEVPNARTLASAVSGSGPGEVRVVCRGEQGALSLELLEHSLQDARTNGFRIRPSQPVIHYSRQRAERRLEINRGLAEQCEYHSIQQAIFDSHNNDRVVVMPGRYREPHSRSQPEEDPECADLVQDNGSGGMAPSYRYQVTCPNDQNLVYIQGRAVGPEPPPEPPLSEREGIPDEGPCVRCNFQLEGSGVKPADVVIDAGRNYASEAPNAKPGIANGCGFEPECAYAKDVVLRVDRADGFVGRNFLVKSSEEHGLYLEEVDGYLIDRVKMVWNAEYGNLTFTSDHGVIKQCDAYGAGDAAVYPGAAPETGAGVEDTEFYEDAPRINTVVKRCDLRSSALAYSGSQGNAVRITHNEVYANTTGIVSDSISAGGHPGYPPDSIEIDHNNIYSNNLDSYHDSPFLNTVGLPIGVGNMWPGVNKSSVHDNYIFDNWRRGTMLLAIPERFTRGTPEDTSPNGACPNNAEVQTSCENRYHDNVMGKPPPGFQPSVAVGKFGNPVGFDDGDARNGVDFWWDEFAGNVGNCWYDNVGPDGTAASLTGDPPISPMPGVNEPGVFLPDVCDDTSVGTGDVAKEAVLANCGTMFVPGEEPPPPPGCDWFFLPPEPGTAAARSQERQYDRAAAKFRRSEEAAQLRARMRELTGLRGG